MNSDNFRGEKDSKDGFNTRCRNCQSLKDHKHYMENREEIIKTNSQHRINNAEKYKQYDKDYYIRRREHKKAMARVWQNENREYLSIWMKEWRKTEHGKSIANMHSRNRSQNKKHKISKKDWIFCKDYFDDGCAYCGMPEEIHKEMFNQQLHKDHADPNGNNGISNCLPSCKICNSKKHDIDWIDWYIPDNPRYTEERYNKIVEWLGNFN